MDSNKNLIYAAVFEKIDNRYIVKFPDLEGGITQGDTFEEALLRAEQVLAIFYHRQRDSLPKPSSYFEIKQQYENEIVQVISINVDNYIMKNIRAVKKTLSIPQWLNEMAEKYQINFSTFLKESLIKHLKELECVDSYDKKMLG